MSRTRATQRETIFYRLYRRFKAARPIHKGQPPVHEYLPVYGLMGEEWIEEVGKWGYVSYECSARASEMIKTNPELIQRQTIKGKSGATYYGYRLNPRANVDMIRDPDLLTFYRRITGNKAPNEIERSKVEAEKVFKQM